MSLYSVYATTTELVTYLGIAVASLPADATGLLTRASELIKYAVIDNIDTTDDDHTEALQLSTCAQIEYWLEMGESISISSGSYKSVGIGSFSVSYTGSSASQQLAVRSRTYLQDQGLLYRGVKTNAYSGNTLDSDLSN